MRARLSRIPAPLGVLLAIAVVQALAWSIALPPLQGPDESGHLAYVQRIAEQGSIPFSPRTGGGSRDLSAGASRELVTFGVWSGVEELRGNLGARLPWTRADERLEAAKIAALGPGARRADGFNVTFKNPPLYYVLATPAYLVASSWSLQSRLMAVRWLNAPILAAIVALTWLLAGELLGAALAPKLLASGLVALQPGLANIAGVAGPDLLLVALWTGGLLACLRCARGEPSWGRAGVVVAVTAAAALEQGRGLPLAVPAFVALALALAHARGWTGRRVAAAGAALAAAAVAASLIVLYAPTRGTSPSLRGFAEYVWQFWLPRLPGMHVSIGPPGYGAKQAFVARLWGSFAQLEVELPGWAVTALTVASLVALAAMVAALAARRERVVASLPALLVVATALLAFFGFLHLTAYRSLLSISSDPVITGRYLLPILPLLAVGLAFAVAQLPRRLMAPVGGALLGAVTVLSLNGLALVVERFGA